MKMALLNFGGFQMNEFQLIEKMIEAGYTKYEAHHMWFRLYRIDVTEVGQVIAAIQNA